MAATGPRSYIGFIGWRCPHNGSSTRRERPARCAPTSCHGWDTRPAGIHGPFSQTDWSFTMIIRNTLAAIVAAAALLTATGCAVTRGQETVGAYVDDAAITTAVKSSFINDKAVDASAISVETLNGTVMLSGFAKSAEEQAVATQLTWKVKGVRGVKNETAVRP